MTNMESFFQHVSGDETLQQELNQAIGGKEGEEALRAIVDLAQAHGFNISIEETNAALSAMAQEQHEDRKLTDEDLEGVAGGSFFAALGLMKLAENFPWGRR